MKGLFFIIFVFYYIFGAFPKIFDPNGDAKVWIKIVKFVVPNIFLVGSGLILLMQLRKYHRFEYNSIKRSIYIFLYFEIISMIPMFYYQYTSFLESGHHKDLIIGYEIFKGQGYYYIF